VYPLRIVGETEREERTMSDTIKALTEAVRGRVITPSDSDYDDAGVVYNALHDRKASSCAGRSAPLAFPFNF
jgi:hypothetical protein